MWLWNVSSCLAEELRKCRLEAGRSVLTVHASAVALQLPSGLFPERFPLSTLVMSPSYYSPTSRQSKFQRSSWSPRWRQALQLPRHCQQHRAQNIGERDRASHGWTPGGWTCTTAQKPDTEIITTSLMKSHEGFNKITALDCHSWIVTNTPPSCTQVAFNYFKFAKARASPTSQHTAISPEMLKSGGKQEQKPYAG